MNPKESKRRQNVTHIVSLFVTVVIYRTHLCMICKVRKSLSHVIRLMVKST